MRTRPSNLTTISVAVAILLAPTAAGASTGTTPAPSSGWVTLSQLNPAGATALAGGSSVALTGSAAAAAQPVDGADVRPNPFPWPVAVVALGVLAAAVYIAFIEHHDHGRIIFPSGQSPD